MATVFELLSVLFFAFGINMIPFASPSNLLIASNAALLVDADPVSIGLLVASGSTCAKLIHYVVTFFVGKHIGKERRKRLDNTALQTKRWAFPAIIIAAASPIPDDPVIVTLGLMKYNPAKFSLAYFAGKLSITIVGASLGGFGERLLGGYLTQGVLAIISIILTIAITVILLKVNLSETAKRLLKKLR
jgi:membrane protein YqaA with SNARE-associated domain